MKTSAAGIEIIKRNEGCVLTAYRDITGVLTIGYGDTQNVREGMTITQQEAEDRLATRLANEFEPAVEAICIAPTTQPQFDAMVSLAWNIGTGAFARSTVARLHKAGQYAGAADAFRMWNKAGGKVIDALVRRRDEERALYLSAPAVPDVPQTAPEISDAQRLAEIADELMAISKRLTVQAA